MTWLRLPEVPSDERRSFKQRIYMKHAAYVSRKGLDLTNPDSERGERYEIAVAISMYRNHILNRSDYLSRWPLPDDIHDQKIGIGGDNEYDFILDDSFGLMLGDAKSNSDSLGSYIKKAISYCLLDVHVRNSENNIRGFCFATPTDPELMWRTTLRNAFELLSGTVECAGITGMDSQQIPKAVRMYFRDRYVANGRVIGAGSLNNSQEYYLAELRTHAGFTFRFLRVLPMSEAQLLEAMKSLAAKERWPKPELR